MNLKEDLRKEFASDQSSDLSKTVLAQSGRLFIMQAANSGNLALLERAIKAGICPDTISDDGSSALHCAARDGRVKMVEYLFHLGASTTIINQNKRPPFQEAIFGGNVATIQFMLDNRMGAMETNNRLLSTFESVLSNDKAEVAEAFFSYIEGKAILAQQGLNLLQNAIKHRNVFFVSRLSSSNTVELNSRYDNRGHPLRFAIRVGGAEIVEVLLRSENLDVNVRCVRWRTTPLHFAVEKGAREVVQLLLQDSRVEVNLKAHDGHSPLYHAVEYKNADMAKLILAHPKVDVNVKTHSGGQGPLFCAVYRSNIEIARLILAHPKVDVNSVESSKLMTALHQAVCNPRVLPSIATLEHPAEALHSMDIDEGGVSEPVINCNNLQMVRVLCQAPGICLNMKDKYGNTPLQLAVSQGCWPIAQYLLRYAEAKNNLGSSAQITLPPLRSSDLPSLLQELVCHEDFKSTKGFKKLLFSAARDHGSEVVNQLSQTQVFETIMMGHDTTAALLCAVCTASHSTGILERILRRPETDVNQKLTEDTTALHAAVMINSPKAVEILLEHDQIDIRTGFWGSSYITRCSEDKEYSKWLGKSAREIALHNYGPQSVIESLFAAHEETKSSS